MNVLETDISYRCELCRKEKAFVYSTTGCLDSDLDSVLL